MSEVEAKEVREDAKVEVKVSEGTEAKLAADLDAKTRKIVIDTGAYCRSLYIDKSGDAIYITKGVLAEIEKYRTKNPLESLTRVLFSPTVREPTEEDVVFVKNFASLTGDLPFLSTTDIECIALTRRLQIETGDTSCLRTEPLPLALDGRNGSSNGSAGKGTGGAKGRNGYGKKGGKPKEEKAQLGFDCWIGPDNAHSYNMETAPLNDRQVACMTTDFAMQNVLMHMGLNVVTLDGFIAKTIRTWGQICRACYEVYQNTARKFCSKCGNATVDRVSLKVDGDSGKVVAKDTRKWINTRGTIYTQPKPSTGRNKVCCCKNVITCAQQPYIVSEDQLLMPGYKNYIREMNRKNRENSLLHFYPDDTKMVDSSLFGGKLVSSLANIQIGLGKGNPNSNRWIKKNKRSLKSL
ncbi:hypothetical protein BEWA_031140 [Theileria equi strain WA]|uniref:RNA-binding protein NOB1 n=1 Tax=Theileria equi strain WA TaxID=1537102 RepID=L0AZ17_THEEQ|nr:hypothetical protein BEWA_031140 [Theileria equi strain WA]AFZ80261.1 hypothetical protein BEWA_031140 [Theileria equi strain WA]|eukprot:XP_004829927.1 hypothetical protein BEWA_031140 [Theileria equi strain WA]